MLSKPMVDALAFESNPYAPNFSRSSRHVTKRAPYVRPPRHKAATPTLPLTESGAPPVAFDRPMADCVPIRLASR